MSTSLLIVDDEPMVLSALARLLKSHDCKVVKTSSPIEALKFCDENNFDLVLADQRMPLMTGCQLLAQIREKSPLTTCILMSAYSDFNDVIGSFNTGTIDQFIPKPWNENELLALVKNSTHEDQNTSTTQMQQENGKGIYEMKNCHGIFSNSPIMLEKFKNIEKAASANVPIFISGETGTGKELCAKAIHLCSHRASKPFISINCANFTEELMESQLFGHRKGSFTGAIADQEGLLSAANFGTLFLDEVTSMNLDLQAKLLRVFQEREFTMVGSFELLPFNGQVLSASSKSLKAAVSEGTFREDLRYRLEVIPLTLPPLRDRKEDIVPLFAHFSNESTRNKQLRLTEAVIDKIESYYWPGNIRQLQNAAVYAAAMTESDFIQATDLPEEIAHAEVDTSSAEALSIDELSESNGAISKSTALKALKLHRGSKTKTAEYLNISRSTLWRILKRKDETS